MILLETFQDNVRSLLGLPPAYIPISGAVGTVALMPLTESELSNYFRKHPAEHLKGGGWQNMAPARVALRVGMYVALPSTA